MKNLTVFLITFFVGLALIAVVLKNLPQGNDKQLSSPQASQLPQSKFSIEKAPTESLKGQIVSLVGQVGWQSREATEPAALSSPIPFQQGERLTTGDNGRVDLTIGNSVEVKISPLSDLNFAQTLPANVVIGQESGTAELISKDQVPVSVRALHLLVTLTSGDMSVSLASESGRVTVAVNKGVATTAYNSSANLSTVNTVNAGESFSFDDNSLEGEVR